MEVAMKRRVAMAVLLCAFLARSGFAADPSAMYQRGVDKIYNLYFDDAEKDFKNLTAEYPNDPRYWNGLASTIWLRILYQQQKLNIESFSFKDTFGTSQSQDDVAAAEEQRLEETARRARDAADALLKKNPKDVHALYEKGASFATLATFHATVKREYWKARGEAAEARDIDKQVLRIDPNFHDAEMSVGAYNYVMGVLPSGFRLLLGVFGMSGDGKDVGLRQLESAAHMGNESATAATLMLLIVYNREGRHGDALKLTEELQAKYPKNFLFEMSRAQVFRKLGQFDQANETYQNIQKKIVSKSNGYERLRLAKVYYDQAKGQTEQKDFGAVYASYAKVVDPKSDATPDERADSLIWMGKTLDSQNNRSAALEHYNAVDKLNCKIEYKEQANLYKKKRYSS
jgi:tetratricopeptide (TPR) repeat protein